MGWVHGSALLHECTLRIGLLGMALAERCGLGAGLWPSLQPGDGSLIDQPLARAEIPDIG